MIAVMGASGNVGSKVADLLLSRNERIRVFEHQRKVEDLARRGAEVVKGDGRNVEDLERLMEDVDSVLVLIPDIVADPQFVANRSRMSHAIADALRETRAGHVVALSTVGADRADAIGPPAGLHEFEQLLFELDGINLMVLRSAFYMENLLANLPLIRSQKINGSAIRGDMKFPMVATQDVAAEAAARLANRDFQGRQARMLLGPEDLSMQEATSLIGSVLGMPDVAYVQFPPPAVREALVGAGMSEEAAALLVDMQMALNEGRPFASVSRTTEATTPTTFEEFLGKALAPEAVPSAGEGGQR